MGGCMKQAQDSHSNTHVKIEVSMMVSLQCTDTMQIMWKSLWLQLSITAYRHCLIMATICIQPTVKPHPNIYNPLKLEEPPCMFGNDPIQPINCPWMVWYVHEDWNLCNLWTNHMARPNKCWCHAPEIINLLLQM